MDMLSNLEMDSKRKNVMTGMDSNIDLIVLGPDARSFG